MRLYDVLYGRSDLSALLTGMIAKNVLRAVSLDVTGTLLRYRGHIGDIYGIAPTR